MEKGKMRHVNNNDDSLSPRFQSLDVRKVRGRLLFGENQHGTRKRKIYDPMTEKLGESNWGHITGQAPEISDFVFVI